MHYNNVTEMRIALNKQGFTVDGHDIFKGAEYAGEWKYKSAPQKGKEDITPVETSMIRKYS